MQIHPTIKNFCLLIAIFCISNGSSAQKYSVGYHFKGKDTLQERPDFLKKNFQSKIAAESYIHQLKELLFSKGYAAASVDAVKIDSTQAEVYLFAGKKYRWELITDSLPPHLRAALNMDRGFGGKNMTHYDQLKKLESSILNYYETTGYPFARVFAESAIGKDSIHTVLKAEKGVLYHIDSIRVFGKARISNKFLQHYLDIFDGDIYNRQKLSKVSQRLDNLPFLQQQQPSDLMMLGTGATLNLYLEPKRSSEVNALIGFLPGNSITGKTKITADVRLNLKNALAGGETILLNWQQLEAQSPKLDLGFNQPYLFNTPYGIDFTFGLLKQDSSYLLLNSRFGIEYLWTANQSVKVFYQVRNSYLLQGGLDTNTIRLTKQLPRYMDVASGSAGLAYHFENLNYRFNPQKGFDVTISASAGIRKVSRNNDILQLKDPAEPAFDFSTLYDTIKLKTYVISTNVSAARYNKLGKNSVLKIGLQGGWVESPQVFQNELFRIGGCKILRGFDEESIYADRYGVLTGEYRLLTGMNSYIFGFTDLGMTHTDFSGSIPFSNAFVSLGLGMELETKFGLLNISYAIGKRNDIKFDIRNASKIHFGYINYF